MSGRPKLKMYQYSSEGLYMRSYETQMEIFDKYYDGKKGELFMNKQYRELPDGTYVSWYRIGQKGLQRQIRIDNDIYCKHYKDDRPLSVYNILGEKIASFNSIRTCANMTGIRYSNIHTALKKPGSQVSRSPFKFEYDQEQRLEERSAETEIQAKAEAIRSCIETGERLQLLQDYGVPM